MKISVSLENGWLVEEENGILTVTDTRPWRRQPARVRYVLDE